MSPVIVVTRRTSRDHCGVALYFILFIFLRLPRTFFVYAFCSDRVWIFVVVTDNFDFVAFNFLVDNCNSTHSFFQLCCHSLPSFWLLWLAYHRCLHILQEYFVFCSIFWRLGWRSCLAFCATSCGLDPRTEQLCLLPTDSWSGSGCVCDMFDCKLYRRYRRNPSDTTVFFKIVLLNVFFFIVIFIMINQWQVIWVT